MKCCSEKYYETVYCIIVLNDAEKKINWKKNIICHICLKTHSKHGRKANQLLLSWFSDIRYWIALTTLASTLIGCSEKCTHVYPKIGPVFIYICKMKLIADTQLGKVTFNNNNTIHQTFFSSKNHQKTTYLEPQNSLPPNY